MHKMFKVLALVGVVAFATPAPAQVGTVPQVGLTTGYLARTTYSAGFIGLVPAASATDVVCLAGSASKTIRLQSIKLSGTAGTLVTLPVTLVRRIAVNTGGTAASTTANPANTIAKRDVGSPTAAAVPIAYTANPTITDSAPTYIDSVNLTLPVTTAGTVVVPTLFDFAKDVENFLQPPTIAGAASQLCLNFNAVSVTSGLLTGAITWTEE